MARFWSSMVLTHGGMSKFTGSLVMLVSWELSNEQNARIFKNKRTLQATVFARIKLEAKSWILAGAMYLGLLMAGE